MLHLGKNDGFTNLVEALSGTDPKNSESVPFVLPIVVDEAAANAVAEAEAAAQAAADAQAEEDVASTPSSNKSSGGSIGGLTLFLLPIFMLLARRQSKK